jgi:hypothetical protein
MRSPSFQPDKLQSAVRVNNQVMRGVRVFAVDNAVISALYRMAALQDAASNRFL